MVRKFDRELKLEAMRMASEEGSTAVEVEPRLGISKGVISRWKKPLRDRGEEAFPGTGHLSDRDEEVRRLRRALGRVTQERDILKSGEHLLGGTVVTRYRLVAEHRAQWGVEERCRVLKVSRSVAAASAQSSGRADASAMLARWKASSASQ